MILAERITRFGFKNIRIAAPDYDSASRFGEVIGEAVYPGNEIQYACEQAIHEERQQEASPRVLLGNSTCIQPILH